MDDHRRDEGFDGKKERIITSHYLEMLEDEYISKYHPFVRYDHTVNEFGNILSVIAHDNPWAIIAETADGDERILGNPSELVEIMEISYRRASELFRELFNMERDAFTVHKMESIRRLFDERFVEFFTRKFPIDRPIKIEKIRHFICTEKRILSALVL